MPIKNFDLKNPDTKISVNKDLRLLGYFPDIFDQEGRHTCSAQALAALIYFHYKNQGIHEVDIPSRLFLYYNAICESGLNPRNFRDNARNYGKPVLMRHCIEATSRLGWCNEEEWQQVGENWLEPPPRKLYQKAACHAGMRFERMNAEIEFLKESISHERPFIFGLYLYESFYSEEVTRNGIIPLPKNEKYKKGAHSMMAVGYDDRYGHFIVRNSMGRSWGNDGYGFLPYDYLENQTGDFWRITI